MNEAAESRAEEIFQEAADLPESQRGEFLDERCGADASLRADVESLLAYYDADDASFLVAAIFDGGAGDVTRQPTADSLPSRLGHYTIRRLIGEGGMGAVYEAVQENPRRTVALKVMHAGVASRSLLRRFQREAQVLGQLRHPGIAQIYEAGMIEGDAGGTARPYFAMELVEGHTLDEYVRLRELDTRGRLELVAKVCDAVQHAHQKGVIHRDLKPANILVDEQAQPPVPKVLDFGVARATAADVRAATMQTEVGQVIGTLAYMSPEQILARPDELDARSDVYALGVILYELLAQRPPYELSGRSIPEVGRIIREEEPATLSTVDTRYRGDLDTIVAKSLAKDKLQRYQSAGELAADLRRYLADEPILARRASTAYQLRKFARRNRGLVGGVAAAFVVLVAGLVVTTWGMARALTAEREAQRRADDLERILQFQEGQLAGISPSLMGATLRRELFERSREDFVRRGMTQDQVDESVAQLERQVAGVNFTSAAVQMLDVHVLERARSGIEEDVGEQPLIRARLLQTLARTMSELGLVEQAPALQAEALQLRRAMLGDEHPDTLQSTIALAQLLFATRDLAGAEPYAQEALDVCRRVLGDEHPLTLTSIHELGNVCHQRGRYSEAEVLYREALALRRRLYGDDDPETLRVAGNLAITLSVQGKYEESEPLFIDTLARLRRVLGNGNVRTLWLMRNHGAALREQGRVAEAEVLLSEAMMSSRRVLGDEHPQTLRVIHLMGRNALDLERYEDAEQLGAEAVAGARRTLPPRHILTARFMFGHGAALCSLGRFEDAEPLLLEAHAISLETEPGAQFDLKHHVAAALAVLYERWHAQEPERGFDAQAAQWRKAVAESD